MGVETLSAPTRATRRRGPLVAGAVVYVVARLATLVVVALVDLSTHHGLVHVLSRWDGEWFLRAADHGWPATMPRVDGHLAASTIAFFPLFPLLLRGLHDATGLSAAVIGLWVSALAGLGATLGVGALTRSYAGDASARRATILFALSPGAFVFSLIYNEGFVVGLAALGLWALTRRRWWVAAAAGAVGTALSPVGLVFLAPVAWVAVGELRARRYGALAVALATPIGFAAWTGYLWAHTGTPRAWTLTERAGWHSYPSLAYPLGVIGKFVTNPLSPTMTGQLLLVGTVVTVAGLYVVWRERPPAPIAVYAVAAAIVFAVAAPVGLRPRFVMLVFPIVMAVATRYRGRVFASIAALSALGLAFMAFETLHSWAIFPVTDETERATLAERAAWSLVWLAIVVTGVDAWGSWSTWPGAAVVAPLVALVGLVGAATLWAVGDAGAAMMRRLALGAALATVVVTDGLDIAARHYYSTDSAAFNDVATTRLLHGHDPYTSSLASAANLLHAGNNYWTYLLNGGHVTQVSYPAGSFLLQAPLAALGLHHLPTDWLDLAAWVATIVILYRALPTAVRWLAPLLLLSGAFVSSFADGGTDALFLPFLALAVWHWDRFSDPVSPRAARWLSPVALGVACSIKQSPWFCVPLLLIGVAAEARARDASAVRAAARYGALTLGSFLVINLAFIAWGPGAWWHGTMLPLFSPLVPDGQGLVTLALHGATGGVDLRELWLAAALVWAGVAAAMALAYPAMKRVWLFVVPVVLFVPGRSLSSYLLDFFPVALVAAVSVRPAPPGAGWRVDRRAALAAIGAPLAGAIGVSAWALTSAPLGLAVERVGTAGGHTEITSITLRVTNRGAHAVAPHFMFTLAGGHPTGFWHDAVLGDLRVIAAHTSATVTIAPPGFFWAPQRNAYWLVTAYTASPDAVSTTSPSRWRYGQR